MSPAAKRQAPSREFIAAKRAAKYILSKTKLRPRIAIVLGSGLGAFADELSGATRIPYGKIPGFPKSTAEGHAGHLVIGKVVGKIVDEVLRLTHSACVGEVIYNNGVETRRRAGDGD